MKRFALSACLLATATFALAADSPTGAVSFESTENRAAYGIGMNIGNSLLRQGFNAEDLGVDVDVLVEGIRDVLAGRDARVSEADLQAAMEAFQETMEMREAEAAERRAAEGQAALAKADAFLAANGKKDGIVTTSSGLQYQVLAEGQGENPTAESTVTVHYRGTLVSGEQFDSSIDRGEPATFPLGRVIPGWTEGVQLVKPGGKVRLFLPPALGYGEQGSPPRIGPNEVLVFEIELLEVK